MPSEMKCPASIIVTNIRSSNRNLKKYLNYISQLYLRIRIRIRIIIFWINKYEYNLCYNDRTQNSELRILFNIIHEDCNKLVIVTIIKITVINGKKYETKYIILVNKKKL